VAASIVSLASSQDYNLSPPAAPVNLLWIHHSTGANWSQKFDEGGSRAWADGRTGTDRGGYATRHDTSSDGGNGELALYNSNYIVHHLSYESILGDGDRLFTDYRNWYLKFRTYLDRNDTAHYVNDTSGTDLVHCYAQNDSYGAQGTDEFTGANVASQTNQVIMFKSCFPNSNVQPPDTSTGLPANPTLAQARTWIASAAHTDWCTNGGGGGPINYIKAEYMVLLDVFGEARNRNTLFVAWVAPPEIDSASAYARQLADWFETQWLSGYAYNNVLLFNYWNVHTGNHQATGACWPAVREKHNHCRYNPFLNWRDYVGPGDPDFVNDIRMAFPTGGPGSTDSHPSHFAGAIATKEFIHLLNIQWNRMKGIASSGATGYPTNGRTGFFKLDSTYSGSLPSGVTKGTIDGVSCLVFNGTSNAYLDLGTVPVVGTGGAFSYCFWYRPTVGSVNYPTRYYTIVLYKTDVFLCHHYAEDDVDSHINTFFGGDYLAGPDHRNNVVDCDTWTHVAFVWDGSKGRHYVDGVQIIETTTGTRTITDNNNHLFIGSSDPGMGLVKGGIREVAVYNRALTPAEVRRIFQANVVPRTSARQWRKY
jgi:hypothetical protein